MKNIILPCVYSIAASLGFGIFFNLKSGKLAAAALGGGVGWLVYLATLPFGNDITGSFAAALAITAYAELMARIQYSPVSIYLAPALIPLVPGAVLYRAMLLAITGDTVNAISTGFHALIITGALAIGIVTASSLLRIMIYRKRLK